MREAEEVSVPYGGYDLVSIGPRKILASKRVSIPKDMFRRLGLREGDLVEILVRPLRLPLKRGPPGGGNGNGNEGR